MMCRLDVDHGRIPNWPLNEKPPILGMIQRGGAFVLHMLDNVQQQTIQPLIQAQVAPGTQVYTDEYNIYSRLLEWGYMHQDC